MVKTADLLTALEGRVDNQSSLIASLLNLFAVQHEQLQEIIAEENPAMIMNGVQRMMTTLKNDGDKIAAMVLANTPADPNAPAPSGITAPPVTGPPVYTAPAAQPGAGDTGSQPAPAAPATGQPDATTGAPAADPNAGKSTARSK